MSWMNLHELREGAVCVTPTEKKDFADHFDILVAGLGTAGAFSALAAAREGAKVLGIERSRCCGGMCTLGAVNGYYYGAIGGLYQEIDRECDALKTVFAPFGQFHPDAKKSVLEARLLEAGVSISYDSLILGIYEKDRQVLGVRALLGEEIRDISCTVLIDGTSEGHLLRMYGQISGFGRRTDGKAQPFTSVRVFRRPDGSLGRTNFDSGYVNQYRAEELSRAILDAHAHHSKALGDEERFLYAAPMIGVREGLHFEGEGTLTLEDILAQKEYPDTLLYAYSDIDKHGKDLAFDEITYQDWYAVSNLSTVAVRIPIPLGCIIPKGVSGFLSTGRCLSMDSYAASAVRMNRDMHRLGEACGMAAVLALSKGGRAAEIDVPRLQSLLERRNCFDPAPERRMGFNFPGRLEDFTPVRWLDDPEELRRVLSTDCPGVAIWSSRRLGKERIGDALCAMMEEGGEMLRPNAAVALGITGDVRALPVLLEIVNHRSTFFFKDCRRTNQLRSAIAVCLCGRLGGPEILPALLEILRPEEFERPLYHELTEPSYQFGIERDFNLVYFQHLSHAAAALCKIAARYPDWTAQIQETLYQALSNGTHIRRITSAEPDTAAYKAAANIWEFVRASFPVSVEK